MLVRLYGSSLRQLIACQMLKTGGDVKHLGHTDGLLRRLRLYICLMLVMSHHINSMLAACGPNAENKEGLGTSKDLDCLRGQLLLLKAVTLLLLVCCAVY